MTPPVPLTSVGSDMRHLRPLTAPELLDRAFSVLGQRWQIILPCAFVLGFASFAQGWLVATQPNAPSATNMVVLLALFVFGELAAAIALSTCFQAWLYPRRLLDFDPLVRSSLSRLFPFMITRLVFDFVGMLLLIWLPAWLLTEAVKTQPPALCAVLAAASTTLGIGLLLHWALASLVVLVERKGMLTGLNRSSELMRTGQGGALEIPPPIVRLLWGLAPVMVAIATGFVAAAVGYNLRTGEQLHTTFLTSGFVPSVQRTVYLSEAAIMLFIYPLLWPLVAVLYTDCRIRREGLDFQMRLLENGGWDGPVLDGEGLPGN